MGERVSPFDTDDNYERPLQQSQQIHSDEIQAPPLSRSQDPTIQPATYIVRVPKDQVYRVPPPENALIVERNRGPTKKMNSSCCRYCCYCCCFLLIAIVVFALIVGILIGVFLKPKTPKFDIEDFQSKNVSDHHRKQEKYHLEYDITMRADKPSGAFALLYDGGGDATLSFREKDVAAGKCPDSVGDSTSFLMRLNGSNFVLPPEVEKSMGNKNSKIHISFTLDMNVEGNRKFWLLNIGKKEMAVVCNFMVDTLAKNTRVLSQKCDAKS